MGEGIPTNLYYRWSKNFLEAGKNRLMGDTAREANSVVTDANTLTFREEFTLDVGALPEKR